MPGPFNYPYMVRARLLEPKSRGHGSVHCLHGTIGHSRWLSLKRVGGLRGITSGLPEVIGDTDGMGTYVRDCVKARLRDHLPSREAHGDRVLIVLK